MVLFNYGSWNNLSQTRRTGAWRKTHNNSVTKIDDHRRMKHSRIPCTRGSSEWYQIQQCLLHHRNIWQYQAIVKGSWTCTSSKIDCPCGQCMIAHSEGISWVFNVERDGKNSTSTVLTGFGTIWLPSIRRCEEIAHWIRVRHTIWPSFGNWAILSGIEKRPEFMFFAIGWRNFKIVLTHKEITLHGLQTKRTLHWFLFGRSWDTHGRLDILSIYRSIYLYVSIYRDI
jgi:hypothetical protein